MMMMVMMMMIIVIIIVIFYCYDVGDADDDYYYCYFLLLWRWWCWWWWLLLFLLLLLCCCCWWWWCIWVFCVESLYLHLFMFHEFSLTCHHLSPNLPVLVTFGFFPGAWFRFGSGICSLQAVGHDEALQAFIFDQRGDVFFVWEIPPGRGWTRLRKRSTRRHKKDHRNMYFTYKQQEFNRNLEGSKGVCRALSRVEKNVKRQLDEAQCTRRRRLGFALLSRLSMPISTCPP